MPEAPHLFSAHRSAEIANRTLFSELAVTNRCKLFVAPAVLAIYASAEADIQRRTLPSDSPSTVVIALADGQEMRCAVRSWDGDGLDGSCGAIRWERLKSAAALSLLKAIVAPLDARGAADGAAIVLSLEEPVAAAKSSATPLVSKAALDWAKRNGADAALLEAARKEADAIRASRSQRLMAEAAERVMRLTPEAAAFSGAPLPTLKPDEVAGVTAASVEAARALLAKAGGSATLHESDHIALLAESDDSALVQDAAALERFLRDWRVHLDEVGVTISEQGRIPVVYPSDGDRWRLLVLAAFGGDASKQGESVTIYPLIGDPPVARPIVIVKPEGDPSRRRYGACLGLARAILHLAGTTDRAPAWANEGLVRVMAERAAPAAAMDAALRKPALAALRSGLGFGPLLSAGYGDPVWTNDTELARAMSYVFVRWLADNSPDAVLRFVEGRRLNESTEQRFQRCFSMPSGEAAARAARWFQTND